MTSDRNDSGPDAYTIEARIAVQGDASLLEGFRERVRQLLVRDPAGEGYEDELGAGRIDYRFALKSGIPFPAFATASAEYPDLTIEVDWTNHAQALAGHARIANGRLVEQSSTPLAPVEDAAFGLEAGKDARLLLAWVCAPAGDGRGWAGYAATAQGHTYFRWDAGALELMSTEDARIDAALEDLALAFASEWLWYDESPETEAAPERRRYAERGWTVRGANVRTERMARLPASRPMPGCEGVAAALRAQWVEGMLRLESGPGSKGQGKARGKDTTSGGKGRTH